MCGIAGLFDPVYSIGNLDQSVAVLRTMNESMVHRGPDAGGIWSDSRGRCHLGHRRLSIIDTSEGGRQPMSSPDGRWMITFNGEIYNFLELRQQLEGQGIRFRSRTDTEVLIAAIQFWGVEALSRLDGMFAFAAFDTVSGTMLLARDPFGEKPLYYMDLPGGGVAFASELQALEKVPGFDGEISLDAMAEVLMFQYIGAPRTIYSRVKKLPPGHWLKIDPVLPPKSGRYFEFRPGIGDADHRPLDSLADEAEDILVRSIRRRMITDVPLGAFLSGGVDSSTVCALVRSRLGLPLKTFSVGFEGAPESEHEAAMAFARHLGTDHHDRVMVPNASEFLFGVGRVLDEPNGDSSCLPTYLLSAFARQQVTVAISGDGGDELFTGYGRYFQTIDDASAKQLDSPDWSAGHAYYSGRILVSLEPQIQELFGFVPDGLAAHLERLRAEIDRGTTPLFCRLRKSDVENYLPGAVLPKVDRMSMQHSLEVRTPFLNVELARFVERLPIESSYRDGLGKLVLRELAYRYLPRGLVDMPKKGFGLPMSDWGRQQLLSVASEMLSGEDSRLRAALGPVAIDRFLQRQRSANGFVTYQVWALAMLESWLRHHPARLPDLALGNARRHKSRTIWTACDLGSQRFAVVRQPECPTQPERNSLETNSPLHESTRNRLNKMVMALSTRYPADYRPIPNQEKLHATPIFCAEKSPSGTHPQLNGCSLFFPDTDPSLEFDDDDLRRFSKAGAASLVFFHPLRNDGSMFRLRPWRANPWRRFLWAVRNIGRRVRTVRFATECKKISDGVAVSMPRHCFKGDDGTDSINRWLLFRGLKQLPPIPIRLTEMAIAPGQRYLLVGSRALVHLSPLDRKSYAPLWAIPNQPHLHRYLDYIPEIIPGCLLPETQKFSEISAWASANDRYLDYIPEVLFSGNNTQAVYFDELTSWLSTQDQSWEPAPLEGGENIVVMTHGLAPGGAERQWCYLAKGLKRKGFKVTFIISVNMSGTNSHYLPLLTEAGIDIIDLSTFDADSFQPHLMMAGRDRGRFIESRQNPFGVRLLHLYRVFLELKPRAVFSQLDDPNLHAAVAGLLADVPRIVLSFRNYNPTRFSYLNIPWFRPAYRGIVGSRRIILTGNSTAANADYAKWIGISESRVACIPNAIDSFANTRVNTVDCLRPELGIAKGQPVVLGVFRLSEEKRPFIFLEVCLRLIAKLPKLAVLIAGIGPLRGEMQAWIDTRELSTNFKLLGLRDDVSSLMETSTLLLLTSVFEGMPNVLLEAQSIGLPVVATRVGGVPDCVLDGETGYICDINDIDAMEDACVKLLGDDRLRSRMGIAARHLMIEGYSIDVLAQRHLDLIQ